MDYCPPDELLTDMRRKKSFAKINNNVRKTRFQKRDIYDMMDMLQKRVTQGRKLWHFYLWHFASFRSNPNWDRKHPGIYSPFINNRIFIVKFTFGVYKRYLWPKKKIYILVLLQTKHYCKLFRLFTISCETRVVKLKSLADCFDANVCCAQRIYNTPIL